MSKLYGLIQVCSKKEATRRGHKRIDATVKNWDWTLESEMVYGGGGEKDSIRVVLRSISTGRKILIVDGTIEDIVAADPLKGLIDLAKRFDDFREDTPTA
jgi:hypothetical protein